ncbi:MAG TPA: hypothetical protein VMN83_05085 [Albitalea sp.]|nr:hypothetical protein [Albitalea sp.]HUG21887.1 hypothetical protein [Albitalea sp.]
MLPDLETNDAALLQELGCVAHGEHGPALELLKGCPTFGRVFIPDEDDMAGRQLIRRLRAEDLECTTLFHATLEGLLQDVVETLAAEKADVPRRTVIGKCLRRPCDVTRKVPQERGFDLIRTRGHRVLSCGQAGQVQQRDKTSDSASPGHTPQSQREFPGRSVHRLALTVNMNSRGRARVLCDGR